MNPKLRFLSCVMTLPLLFSCGTSKKNKAKLIMIIQGGKAKVMSSSEMNPDEPLTSILNPWQPGAVALFRTTETTPDGETGKAGEAYVIDENKKLRKIGEFDPKKSDAALQAAYAYY